MFFPYNDEFWMKQALVLAQEAFEIGEIPVGAVVVCENQLIAKGRNQVEQLKDATAHAEMIATTAAMQFLGAKYLTNCTIYITLEPCVMCAGAIKWAQYHRIVFGASDPKGGFLKIAPSIFSQKTLISSGILADEASNLLKSFFKSRRNKYK
ncbi:MAG: nucleoside deaminase [Bacteroidia bacterium]|nr:nucleoside deaminase [Bacteroidia bacterium]